jgi:hypothetical protein
MLQVKLRIGRVEAILRFRTSEFMNTIMMEVTPMIITAIIDR